MINKSLNYKRDPSLNNEKLIKEAKLTNNKDIRDKIINNNIPFVKSLADRWFKRGVPEEFDDLVGMGMVALMKAYNTYDTNKNIKFTSYLGKVVWKEFMAHSRYKSMKCRSKYSSISFNETLHKSKGTDEEKLLAEVISNDSHLDYLTVEDEMFNTHLVKQMDALLAKKERVVADKYFFEGKSISEIGVELGVSRQAAHQAFQRTIKRLKPIYTNWEVV